MPQSFLSMKSTAAKRAQAAQKAVNEARAFFRGLDKQVFSPTAEVDAEKKHRRGRGHSKKGHRSMNSSSPVIQTATSPRASRVASPGAPPKRPPLMMSPRVASPVQSARRNRSASPVRSPTVELEAAKRRSRSRSAKRHSSRSVKRRTSPKRHSSRSRSAKRHHTRSHSKSHHRMRSASPVMSPRVEKDRHHGRGRRSPAPATSRLASPTAVSNRGRKHTWSPAPAVQSRSPLLAVSSPRLELEASRKKRTTRRKKSTKRASSPKRRTGSKSRRSSMHRGSRRGRGTRAASPAQPSMATSMLSSMFL